MLDVFFGKLKAGIFKATAKDIKRMKDVSKALVIEDSDLEILKQAREYLEKSNVKDTDVCTYFISETYKFYKTGKVTIRLDLSLEAYDKIVKHVATL